MTRKPCPANSGYCWALETVTVAPKSPRLLIGDFNTGLHFRDEVGKTFVHSDRFEQLGVLGWVDLWRRHNAESEFTWYSRRRGGALGNGFRLDHAFGCPQLAARVQRCWYSHDEREAGLSDHSILMLDLD